MPFQLTKTVKAILIVLAACFLTQQTLDHFFQVGVLNTFGLIPVGFVEQFKVWQIVTYAFLHADLTHFLLNALMLAMIGSELEARWKAKRFISFSLASTLTAGFAYLFLCLAFPENLTRPMVGASGAIYGMLLAYGLYFGDRQMLFMMVFPMKAKHFVALLGAIEFFSVVFLPGRALQAVAHLGGMAGGFIYLWVAAWITTRSKLKSSGFLGGGGNSGRGGIGSRNKNNLKLVVDNDSHKKLKSLGRGRDLDSNDTGGDDDSKTWH